MRDLKEKLCYVPLDYEAEIHRSLVSTELDKNYELPYGQIITLGMASLNWFADFGSTT